MRRSFIYILLSLFLMSFMPQSVDAQFNWTKVKSKKGKEKVERKKEHKKDKKQETASNPETPVLPSTPVVSETPVTPVVSETPVTPEDSVALVPSEPEDLTGHWTDGVITATLILPFNVNAATTEAKRQQVRMAEFYQGFLIAVNEIQRTGRQIKVQTFDSGTSSVRDILERPEVAHSDFIIAPMDDAQVREVADYGESLGIPVVNAFGFDASMLDQAHKHLFQVGTPKGMMYDDLSRDILNRFQNEEFVFVKDESATKPDPFPAKLLADLKKANRPVHEISYSTPETLMKCDSILNISDKDILFIPVTPDKQSMRKMFSGLQHVKIARDTLDIVPKISVLGYPEWALHTNDFIDYYYDLNVYMFSKVYINPFDIDVRQFYYQFKTWYHKDLMPTIPKYGLLGYDMGNYFIKAVDSDGANLEHNVRNYKGETLQTAMCFEHPDDKGFYNTGLYLVHFTPESTIEKIVIE